METFSEERLHEPIATFMRRDFTSLRMGQTIAQALDSLRQQPVGEKIIYFYVLDDEGRLMGVVPTRRLLMSGPDEKLDEIMIRSVVTIPDTMSVLEACEFFVMYRLLAFPVVDADNRLLGVVDVNLFTDQMMDLSEGRPASPDIFQLIGIHIAQGRRGSPWAGFKDRFPWLLCNIAGGIGCAFVTGWHERLVEAVIALALFIPLVLTLAEGVSMQSMTLTLQSFVGERVNWKMILRSLRLELLTALLLGLGCGAVVAILALLWKGQPAVSVAIGLSISIALMAACLLGVIVPSVVRWMKGDPKFASGPIVLATADVTTMIVYFFLAGLILRHP